MEPPEKWIIQCHELGQPASKLCSWGSHEKSRESSRRKESKCEGRDLSRFASLAIDGELARRLVLRLRLPLRLGQFWVELHHRTVLGDEF